MADQLLDCAIIGGGPAGLTAAIYLARFQRNVRVFDAGHSRAAKIPLTHNYPGFPNGISGYELLTRLRRQAGRYGIVIIRQAVTTIERSGDTFVVTFPTGVVMTRMVLLATGVKDKTPNFPGIEQLTMEGLVRVCPICDAYEVTDQKVALLSSAEHGLPDALFLRSFTADITVFTLPGDKPLSAGEVAKLKDERIDYDARIIVDLHREHEHVTLTFETGELSAFDTIYAMTGCDPQVQLATPLKARCSEDGQLMVDEFQETSVRGLYAAGDVVTGLNQMAVGMAHATIAATAIHSSLPRHTRSLRPISPR